MKHQTTSPGDATPKASIERLSTNGSIDTATVELLTSWRVQDATDNPDQLREAERELVEFKKAMNESRIVEGESLLYP